MAPEILLTIFSESEMRNIKNDLKSMHAIAK